nr:hypothetical protein [Tanacetum cinerariifolium]
GLSQWLEKMEPIFYISSCAIDNQVKFATCTLLGTLKKKLTDKYCPKGKIKKLESERGILRPKTLDDAIELANDLMDQKLRTYAERQNDNKKKANDSSRNYQQQQPHKKQNVARAYSTGPSEKKAYTRNLPLYSKCNYKQTNVTSTSMIQNKN